MFDRSNVGLDQMNETERSIQVGGGDCLVSTNALDVFCTVLGSCVAACVYDPVAGIGGMNHFVLPFGREDRLSTRYGESALPALLDQLSRAGASRNRLRAKLYGGAQTLVHDSDIGHINAVLARRFFEINRIAVTDTDLGGHSARSVRFHPASGRSTIRVVSHSLSHTDIGHSN
jgi:chemotaxis protein CheD